MERQEEHLIPKATNVGSTSMTHKIAALSACSPMKIVHATRQPGQEASAAGRNETVCAALARSHEFCGCLDLSGTCSVAHPVTDWQIKQRAPARRPQISSYILFLFVELILTFSLLKHFIRLCVFMCIPNTPEQMHSPIIKYGFLTLKETGVYGSTNSPWLNTHVFKIHLL